MSLVSCVTLFAAAPTAHGDVVDLIIEPVQAALMGLPDAPTGVDPAAAASGLDLSSSELGTNALITAVYDLQGLLESYWTSVDVLDSALVSASDSISVTVPVVLHGLEQDWITSP
ncbi:hypothetical protein, partial [Mycobacterium sp.]|uniref:hypothetical protein n=1 Tax=Mycobacterium sp. TaxID=1785 RepID=UPI00128303DD